jgi:hypothetical protein
VRKYPSADTVSTANFRCKRGIALYKRYADRIRQTAPWTYLVPSQSGKGIYLVYMKPGEECCSCPDYAMHHALDEEGQESFFCKHYFDYRSVTTSPRGCGRRRAPSARRAKAVFSPGA